MKIAVMADSSSGINKTESENTGVIIAPVPLYIDGELFYEDLTVTQEEFFKRQIAGADISTSQPNPEAVSELWAEALKENDAVIYIPISGGLSQTGHILAQIAKNDERFCGKVFVVDNYRVSATQRQSALDAVKMAKDGKTAQEIYDYLMQTAELASIYITVDNLKYLKKSGRITPAVAAIGNLFKIKPVLKCGVRSLDTFAKVRKLSEAKKTMIAAIKSDLQSVFKGIPNGKLILGVAYTNGSEKAEEFKAEVMAAFPDIELAYFGPLPLSVASHIGPDALAVGCTVKY